MFRRCSWSAWISATVLVFWIANANCQVAGTNNVVAEVALKRWTKQSAELGLSLIVQVPKTTYRSGDKIEAEMLIRNDAWKPIQVYVPGLHGRIKYLVTPTTEVKGGLSTDAQMVFGRPARGDRTDMLTLGPGEFIGRKFKLDDAHSGEFRVTASYTTNLEAADYLLVTESSILKVE